MGKHKFRFSDMVPHAWFYKLRDMGQNRRKNHNYSPRESLARKSFTYASSPKLSFVSNRGSYYYSTAVVEARKNLNSPVFKLAKRQDADLPLNTPRKMKRRIHRRHCKVLINSPSTKRVSTSSSFRCNCSNGSDKCEKDVTENYETCLFYSEKASRITDFNSESDRKCSISTKLDNTKNSSGMIEIGLSPIRTRSDQVFKENDNSFNEDKKPHLKVKRASQRAQRIRTRVVTSPKIGTRNAAKEKKLNKDLKESLAVRKFSSDPQRDFTDSMIEMIIANNMRSSSDLEDLLACYLCLNSDDYHSVIVKAFKQVWLDLSRLRVIE